MAATTGIVLQGAALHRRLHLPSAVTCSTKPAVNMSTARTTGAKNSRREVVALISVVVAGHHSAVAVAAAAEAQEEKYIASASGLEYCDTLMGMGDPVVKGTLIKAHYTGKLEDGTVFDSSYKRGKPLSFNVGVGQVIRGWDEGILGGNDVPPMLPGGKRKLRIPPSLGYGERGAGCTRGKSCIIPPNSVLLFDVELLGKAYN